MLTRQHRCDIDAVERPARAGQASDSPGRCWCKPGRRVARLIGGNDKTRRDIMIFPRRTDRAVPAIARRALLTSAVIVTGGAAALAPAVASAAPASGGRATATPALGALYGVDGTSAHDVWAVGSGPAGTLTEHWNGTNWK